MALFDRPIAQRTFALVRFGTGYPGRGSPTEPDEILVRLIGPDTAAEKWPVISFDTVEKVGKDLRSANQKMKKGVAGSTEAVDTLRTWIRDAFARNFTTELVRWAETEDPFRERLHRFWANHFAARSRSLYLRAGAGGYAADAIRPHLAGHFADMLKAVVTHPFMLTYLDQTASVGPNSRAGRKSGRGLNENLAREILELHTLGVEAAYSQADVTQFAELLTGLTFKLGQGAVFRPNWAEPGAEKILGNSYGGGKPRLKDIYAALDDLALHPATAAHICRKLAAHFVADDPDPGLVTHMVEIYSKSGGHLLAVYAAMLEHPAAWSGYGAKVKPPFDFVATGLRALGLRAATLHGDAFTKQRGALLRSLRRMGQDYQKPPGPDGWPDVASAWVHPSGVAARIAWAMQTARQVPDGPPDPRLFVADALGDSAGSKLVWAAGAAESRAEGVGVVLASAEFNRR